MQQSHFEIQHTVNLHLNVVTRDTDLGGDIECGLFQGMTIADAVKEWIEQVKPSAERA
jgi:hypothetical protein